MKQQIAPYPCPYCSNDDASLIELIVKWQNGEMKLICTVCSKKYEVRLEVKK